MHFEDADLVSRPEAVLHGAEDTELVAALALEIEHGIDHVLDHARARDGAFLGDVADKDQRRAGLLRPAHQLLRAGPHLRDRAGRRFQRVGPDRLDRVDDNEAGVRLLQRREDLAQVRLGRELDRRVRDFQPPGPLLDLRCGFLAGDIDGLHAVAREPGCRLQQQRGFADAGIAADQRGGGGHDAAAEYAVEFFHADQHAGRGLDIGVQGNELGLRSALGGCLLGFQRAGRGAARLLDQRVPLPARLAAARPFGVHSAAGLADEGRGRGFGHAGALGGFGPEEKGSRPPGYTCASARRALSGDFRNGDERTGSPGQRFSISDRISPTSRSAVESFR